MRTAELGSTILIAQMGGDRPAIITKVYANTSVEACAFMPMPEALGLVKLHNSRVEAIQAGQQNTGFHAYWPAKS